ncbi:hypothetical protein [Kosmotoga olearia]|uniref:Fimbrial assembly family protein n=1 Tax=Kosmotoga olearia (strain ATCC BAA-1733 / DSM 21960 / TBF 19.5.1) TaxID=521045 RepID=C5CGG3_KOSOT|nr:hypothetical protein [Kosmotoga olearia]ACR80544.1 hypothetical protein Kole_1862 [Kosmotoga olearia TBF 19.5.1]
MKLINNGDNEINKGFMENFSEDAFFLGESLLGSGQNRELLFVSEKYKNRIKRKVTPLHRKGIPTRVAGILIILTTITAFLLFVGFYMFNAFRDVSRLTTEIEELEQTYYQVQKLSKVANETVAFLSSKSNFEELAKLLGISTNTKGKALEGIYIASSAEDTLKIMERLTNDPKVIMKKISIKSNLGFPILPKTDLPTNVVVELTLDLYVTDLF